MNFVNGFTGVFNSKEFGQICAIYLIIGFVVVICYKEYESMNKERKNDLILRNLCDLALEAHALVEKIVERGDQLDHYYEDEFDKVQLRLASLSEVLTAEIK